MRHEPEAAPESLLGFEIAPLAVRLERVDDTSRKLGELLQRFDYLMFLKNVSFVEDEKEVADDLSS